MAIPMHDRRSRGFSAPTKIQNQTQIRDPETVEALIEETMRVLMDLHRLHQRLIKASKSGEAERHSPLNLAPTPRFSRTGPAPGNHLPSQASLSSTRPIAPLSLSSSRCSSMAENHDKAVLALTDSSSRCASPSSSAATPPTLPCKSPLRKSCIVDGASNRRDSILGPAIALCDELLGESIEVPNTVHDGKGPEGGG
ncbi:hypothetical protein CERZMDRAFT_91592 [Cercospora zeae-maydis SCOH1-5]|uniref:Uncharacterized protein n=1 Tax=Cercospora zeae-maydis SCOH1-5 TaxID=717836 RepID=A0A6A6F3J2_9PEZI|nr:hypothetical protein CERZMDRAFT_91592 [Cercospora zeae-maydis SCOH1-5]